MGKYEKKFNISIIGFGFLGSSLAFGFSNYANIKIYDKYKDCDSFDETIKHGDILFFCLPTPFYKDNDGRQDLNILEGSISDVHDMVNEKDDKVAVIKSTVLPGVNKYLQDKYPKLHFVSNPEFLSADSARIDFLCAARNILGGESKYVDRVDDLYKHRFGNSLLTYKTTWEQAELTKYANNTFFALKLSFFNYIYSVCEKINCNFDNVRDMIISDSRCGRSHHNVPGADGKRGWGSFCFPKDMMAFMNYSQDIGVDPGLLKAAWEQNLKDRGSADWENLGPSVVSYKNKKNNKK